MSDPEQRKQIALILKDCAGDLCMQLLLVSLSQQQEYSFSYNIAIRS